MKKISLLICAILCLIICGCDSYKTTKQLCQTPNKEKQIKQRIQTSTTLEYETKEALIEKDSLFFQCLADYGYKDKNMSLLQALQNNWGSAEIKPLLKIASKKELNSSLMIACEKGDIELTHLLLDNGASINFLSETKETPLSRACSSGNLDLVKFLIDSGAGKKLGKSPITESLRLKDKKKSTEIVNYLSEKGVNFSFEDLVVASEEGMTNIVNKLLSLGISPESSLNTYTPLMAASKGGHVDIIKILLKTKAGKKDITKRSCDFFHPRSPIGIDQTRIEDYDAFNGSYLGYKYMLVSALLYAIKSENVEATKLLLEAGADPNYDTSLCKEDQRANPNSYIDETGCFLTPLILASQIGNLELIQLLVKHGADINYQCISIENVNLKPGFSNFEWRSAMDFKMKFGERRSIIKTAFSEAKDDETRNLLAQLGASR